MSTMDERRERAATGVALNADTDGWYGDFARPRIVLQPIAAPSVLGLLGFAGATFIVAANMANWYGTAATPGYLLPFAFFFGGVAQFAAGLWAYRARDAVATAMHGMWGSFWLAWGVLELLVVTGQLSTGTTFNHAYGFWFIPLCAITVSGTLGAFTEGNFGMSAVFATISAAAAVAAVGFLRDNITTQHAAGWVFVAAAALAWYMGTAMMLTSAAGKVVLPLFKREHDANVPGKTPTRAIQLEWAEPGIKHGQ
jgi:succinate-acetate transporter protein